MSRLAKKSANPLSIVFLGASLLCLAVCAVNVATSLGWLQMRVHGFSGFHSLWKWALASVICLVLGWYTGRGTRN